MAACVTGHAAAWSRARITLTASAARHSGARNDVRGQRACSAARRRRRRRATCHSHSRARGSSRAGHSGTPQSERGQTPGSAHNSATHTAGETTANTDHTRTSRSAHNTVTHTEHETAANTEHTHTRRSAHNSVTHAGHEGKPQAEGSHTPRSAHDGATHTGSGGRTGGGHGHAPADTNTSTHTPAVESVEAPATARESRIEKILATQCENTELTPTPEDLAEVEAATLCLINQERARHDERPLRNNRRLQQAAQGHSEEMIADDYFAHIAPSGMTPVQRVEGTGYIPNAQAGYTIGENIAWGTLELSTPSSIVAAWIASPEHLANILYAPYRDTGIGVVASVPASFAEGQPGAMYSQEFGVIEH
jgi:uncharacterized protein YkwD